MSSRFAQGETAYIYFGIGNQYHQFEIAWSGDFGEMVPSPPSTAMAVHVTRAALENHGTFMRLVLDLSGPAPGAETSWGFGMFGVDTAGASVASAGGWNHPGFGFQRLWEFPGPPEFLQYRNGSHDFVAMTLNQTGATTLELELTMAQPVVASSGAVDNARYNLHFYDSEGTYTSTYLRLTNAQTGWDADLLTLTDFAGVPFFQLDPPTIEGNRIRVQIPLAPIPVRDQFQVYVASRLTIDTPVGEVFTTDVDALPDTGLVAMSMTNPPEIVVSAFPQALIQQANVGGAATTFTLTNAGELETTITLTRQGDFFTLNPAVFPLAPGASQVVTVTGEAKPAGDYSGAAVPTGLGVPEGLTVPILMLVATPPTSGEAQAQATDNRVDLSAPASEEQVEGEARFTNIGTATLTGLAVADVPWIVIPQPLVTIPPGETVTIPFLIDRSKRNDAHDPLGSVVGTISLRYLTGSGSAAVNALLFGLGGTVPVSTTLVTVTDTAKPQTSTGAPLPLGAGEVALFLSSVGHVQSPVGVFISDIQISALQPVSGLTMTYSAAGQPLSASRTVSMSALSTAEPLGFADFTKTVFEQDNGLGTLQIRGGSLEGLEISASVFNKSNPAGTYGSAVPALRSDRSIGAGETQTISGVMGTSAAGRTNFIVQETSGRDATVIIDLLDANGSVLASKEELVPAFQHARLNNLAPAGAVAARITVKGGSAGRVLAYATPLDALSGDTWIITDWPRVFGFDAGQRQIIPIAGRVIGANNNLFRTSLAITNGSASAANAIVRFISNVGAVTAKTVTIEPSRTAAWDDVLGELLELDSGLLGYIEVDPQGTPLAVTSRTFATVGDDPKTFGTGVPTIPAQGLALGDVRRISGFDDADTATIIARLPATFRTNLGLVETSGKAATVKLTLHFRHPQGTRLTVVGSASKEISVGPNQFILLQNVSREILGTYRESLQGNLKNLFLDVEIVSGEGRVVGFVSSVDNGSADQLFKLE
ncbi:MAG: hypothetical protein ACRD2J_12185 [Thermoanaerobaculia bacterium]